jgi:putative transcriptional regulator
MTVSRAYKSDAFEAIHSAVTVMMEAGTIDRQTMRRFDETGLASPDPMLPEVIKALHERNHVTQPVFGRHLNFSP